MIEAEFWAVLNTLTDHDFHDAFKNGRSPENSAHVQKGATSRVMVAIMLTISF
jgi:hypothetical protein